MSTNGRNELTVITKAKNLCSYVLTVTDKSPKKFRFTLVAKLQNNALDALESLFLANEIFVGDKDKRRIEYHPDTGKVIRRLRTSNKRRFKRRLKKFQQQYSQGEIIADKIKQSLASYNGHLKHGHIWKLKKKVYGKLNLT